jgi:zinc transporter 2
MIYAFLYISKREPTEKMSFGYHRTEILGALGNLFIIWVLTIFLIYEATLRIINKEFVEQPLVMLIVGVGGLFVNIIMYFVLHGGGGHSHGLMTESCDHHHVPHENEANLENCTNSFCNELLCED